MQVNKIKSLIADYRTYLQSPHPDDLLYYWEIQQNWQQHWNSEADDLAGAYDRAMNNSRNHRPYRREAYDPKLMMLNFIREEPAFVQDAFRDLFHDERDLNGRLERFVFYCDQMMDRYRKGRQRLVHPVHYHDDGYQMLSLYLMGQFPDRYAPYSEATFLHLMELLGARPLPLTHDFPRYQKVLQTLYTFQQKDSELMELHQNRLQDQHYAGTSLLLPWDMARFGISRSKSQGT